ncbi:T9SS type A sorting domain-containing protein [candidate division WOR-3 bacterium]|uniref:T9SS type A sorting domain-containing protein n=1 Tax=candidate division WOR-3 bacterium TaxID=2052148 RepID=A0A937XH68_UNCW3|nr:T9SS type A sorting domain-containing protein [candidate division WOR-3 bacterium]
MPDGISPLDTLRLANGVYFLRLEAGAARHSTRLVVAR